MTRAYIALGSNLGKRQAALPTAVARLQRLPHTTLLAIATFRETEPVDAPPGSPRFINSAAAIDTELAPLELLQHLLQIERDLGRLRDQPNAPRTIDLDLLFYGDSVLATPELTLPHPRLHRRRFVLEPLAEIAPDLVHPALRQTIRELLAQL